MGLRIRTNVASLHAQRNLSHTTEEIKSSMGKLATGARINKAADDAAGLAISENLRADIRSLGQAKRNTSDGISLIQTAEGGLEETTNMLIRLRELAIYSASDTIGNTERKFLDQEYLALKDEIDRIANVTEFNGTKLLVGDTELPDELASDSSFPLEIQVNKDYLPEADSIDTRNPVNIIRVDFNRINAFTSGEGSLELGSVEEGTRVDTKASAQKSIAAVDFAIGKVNDYRAYLGSLQNRMTSSVNHLDMQIENITESRSRIRDTDFAVETAKMTQANILQQAGTAVLAAANQAPQVALSLLG